MAIVVIIGEDRGAIRTGVGPTEIDLNIVFRPAQYAGRVRALDFKSVNREFFGVAHTGSVTRRDIFFGQAGLF